MASGTVLSIERCSLHDGPGLRTTVFVKGCPLSCLWCHNPESLSFRPELFYLDEKCTHCGLCGTICSNHTIGTNNHAINRGNCNACGKCTSCPQSAIEIKGMEMAVQDVIDIVLKDVRYYQQSGGGMTLSGGEPLAQFDFTMSLLQLAKENGIHTCLETSGHAAASKILSLVPYVDLFLYDYKASNENDHKKFTGVSHKQILDNLHAINDAGAKIILRCPIIPNHNDTDEHFNTISNLANTLCNVVDVNIMPYHPMGSSKAKRVGREYNVADIGFPTDDQVAQWRKKVKFCVNM